MPTTASAHEIQSDFDAIAQLTPQGDRLGPHEEWLLKSIPSGRGTVLEIGCGVGRLARRLSAAFDRTVAIDFSAGMIAEARRRTAATAPIEYLCADMFAWLRGFRDSYDCIVTVGTLHHVDLRPALREMALSLKPGGRLLVLDLFTRSGWRYLFVNVVAWMIARAREMLPLRRANWKLLLAFLRHGQKETYLTLQEVEQIAREELPGSNVRSHLLWRYSIIWNRPQQLA
jgi:SAM-dependent methyltransferase